MGTKMVVIGSRGPSIAYIPKPDGTSREVSFAEGFAQVTEEESEILIKKNPEAYYDPSVTKNKVDFKDPVSIMRCGLTMLINQKQYGAAKTFLRNALNEIETVIMNSQNQLLAAQPQMQGKSGGGDTFEKKLATEPFGNGPETMITTPEGRVVPISQIAADGVVKNETPGDCMCPPPPMPDGTETDGVDDDDLARLKKLNKKLRKQLKKHRVEAED